MQLVCPGALPSVYSLLRLRTHSFNLFRKDLSCKMMYVFLIKLAKLSVLPLHYTIGHFACFLHCLITTYCLLSVPFS